MSQLILASQSPRRKQLLEWANIPFEVVIQHTDERYPPDLPTQDIPVYIAQQKALAVQAMIGNQKTILAADTVVVLNNQIIGKPIDKAHAIATITALAGQTHQVITGVVIQHGATQISFADTTSVSFHPLTAEQIEYYVEQYQPYDKAGAYAIQEWIGVVGIKGIQGDFYNVMGLPISRVVQSLQTLQVI